MEDSRLKQLKIELDTIALCLKHLNLAIERTKGLCANAEMPNIMAMDPERPEDIAPDVLIPLALSFVQLLKMHLDVQAQGTIYGNLFVDTAIRLSVAIDTILFIEDLGQTKAGEKDIDKNFEELTKGMKL